MPFFFPQNCLFVWSNPYACGPALPIFNSSAQSITFLIPLPRESLFLLHTKGIDRLLGSTYPVPALKELPVYRREINKEKDHCGMCNKCKTGVSSQEGLETRRRRASASLGDQRRL